MNNFNLNAAVNNIKALVNNCRCVNCDKINGTRLRYICGHTICDQCSVICETCMLCSPPSNTTPLIDKPLTQRVKHISELLESFQEFMNIDVYRYHRISEQLKAEKELFPECIQAPVKYFNKRKSSFFEDKENMTSSPLPGEYVTRNPKAKMESSINYVQQWLNQSINAKDSKIKRSTRTPFADLNVNSPNTLNLRKAKSNKRPSNENYDSSLKSKKLKTNTRKETKLKIKAKKDEHCESGIGMEVDTMFLDDTPNDILDKDKLALIAVAEAEQNDSNFIDCDVGLNEQRNEDDKVKFKSCCQSTSMQKIPFIKKGPLVENCYLCTRELLDRSLKNKNRDFKNVIVTIDNKSFETTIKLSELKPYTNKYHTKKSVAVQSENTTKRTNLKETSLDENEIISEAIVDTNCEEDINKYDSSRNNQNTSCLKPRCIVIEDSDTGSSDGENEKKELEIEAEVHRSSDIIDYVLNPLEVEEYTYRTRAMVRGKTPASSDSSDKENFDPNKRRRFQNNKKNKNKKR